MKSSPFRFALVVAAAAALSAQAQDTPQNDYAAIARNLDIFNSAFKELSTFYVDTIDAQKSIESALVAMLDEIDPYTEYIPAEMQDEFMTITTGEYGGIGAVITQMDGAVHVSEPYEDSPAARAGLKPGDKIVIIDGDSVIGCTTSQVSERLRGTPNTKITVTIERPYGDGLSQVEITREKIKIPAVPYYGVTREHIGYIALASFSQTAPDEMRQAVTSLTQDPRVKMIAIDLRGNGGGLLESAVQIVGMFVPKGTQVLQTRGRLKLNEKTYKTTQEPIDTQIPLVVLIDGGSASSSEIVAGSLQDLDRALIVGSRSFGKGLVQTTRQLPYDGLLKVTISKYYIPSGRLIQAIDYSRRNDDGSVARIPDSLTTVFHTANGREVRDGGGITPDIAVDYPPANRLAYNVTRDNWAFKFAVKFAHENPTICPPEEFEITDSIYEAFKNFIDPNEFKYDKVCEDRLRSLRNLATSEGYMNDAAREQFDILEGMLKHDLKHDLDTHRREISEILGAEIMKHYYFQRGQLIDALKYDDCIDRVAELLADDGQYQKLLSGPADQKTAD